jgi:DNA-binding NtrC family response regulator
MAHRILIVDDNEQLRRALAVILDEEGYSATEVSGGNEAMYYLNSTEFSLVIADLVMPEMKGLELITALRKSHPKLSILAISGSSEGEFVRGAKLLGVKEILQIPFDRSALLKTVESALSKASPLLP